MNQQVNQEVKQDSLKSQKVTLLGEDIFLKTTMNPFRLQDLAEELNALMDGRVDLSSVDAKRQLLVCLLMVGSDLQSSRLKIDDHSSEADVAHKALGETQAEVSRLHNELQDALALITSLDQKTALLESTLNDSQAELVRSNEALEQSNEKLAQTEEQLHSKMEELFLFEQKLSSRSKDLDSKQQELDSKDQDLNSKKEQLTQLETELGHQKVAIESLNDELKSMDLEHLSNMGEKADQIAQLEAQIVDLEQENSNLLSTKEEFDQMVDGISKITHTLADLDID